MLKTYLNTLPFTKFIIIEDALARRDPTIFEYLVNQHLDKNHHKLHYFVFEGIFKRAQKKYQNHSNIVLYDFVTDSENWLDGKSKDSSFENVVQKLGDNDIVIVDSLSNIILLYGLSQTYRIFNRINNNKAIQQIISVLHSDLIIGDDYSKASLYFEKLCSLSMHIRNPFLTDKKRIEYKYVKRGGKIISEIEEYKFEGGNLVTNKIEKPYPKKILEKTLSREINPEDLSTFRIGLTDEEKLSREKVVLPYLPKAKEEEEEGKIFYQLDEVDDWDEEDPDDDLDI